MGLLGSRFGWRKCVNVKAKLEQMMIFKDLQG
jgi:hypothetical protein